MGRMSGYADRAMKVELSKLTAYGLTMHSYIEGSVEDVIKEAQFWLTSWSRGWVRLDPDNLGNAWYDRAARGTTSWDACYLKKQLRAHGITLRFRPVV
jgi:hypothetical protein